MYFIAQDFSWRGSNLIYCSVDHHGDRAAIGEHRLDRERHVSVQPLRLCPLVQAGAAAHFPACQAKPRRFGAPPR